MSAALILVVSCLLSSAKRPGWAANGTSRYSSSKRWSIQTLGTRSSRGATQDGITSAACLRACGHALRWQHGLRLAQLAAPTAFASVVEVLELAESPALAERLEQVSAWQTRSLRGVERETVHGKHLRSYLVGKPVKTFKYV